MFLEVDAVVVDNGSTEVRIGIGGDKTPRSVFPSSISRLRPMFRPTFLCGGGMDTGRVPVVTPFHPIQNGVVTDWSDMEKIWKEAFYQRLGVNPEDRPVLITESPSNTKSGREKMAQIMFETFKVPGLYIAIPQLLSLYSTGRITGVVVDIGFDSATIVPIFEGYPMRHAIVRLGIGGRRLTEYMKHLLIHRADTFDDDGIRGGIFQNLKERFGYVALDFKRESTTEQKVELENGREVVIGRECFQCPEALFQPSYLGEPPKGIHQAVCESICKCDADIHSTLFKNIVLSGGSALFPGITKRLQREVATFAPANATVKVVTREESVFVGGSILVNLPTFQDLWVTKQQFEEDGPSILARNCF